jgi:hypothetical protein
MYYAILQMLDNTSRLSVNAGLLWCVATAGAVLRESSGSSYRPGLAGKTHEKMPFTTLNTM